MRYLPGRAPALLLIWISLLGAALATLKGTMRPVRTTTTRNAISRIRQAGVLRVGTTGDYDPFSFLDSSGNLRGIDVDVARLLARAIDPKLRVRFVKTTWPTLTVDLLAGRFDIAMSGVSRNKARGEAGALSASYLADSKVALIRVADREKRRTLADLDSPGVTVLVNPGGTNQQFVNSRIKKANIVVVRDNLSIPRLIAEGKGDVMFTDGAEGKVYSRRDPRLCVALTDPPLLNIEKVYYLPKGQPELLKVVNALIDSMRSDGSLARLWAKYVGG